MSTEMSGQPALPEVLLHVGYHKTGTSFLQQCLFSAPSSGFLYPKEAAFRIIPVLVKPHPFKFAPQQVLHEFEAELDQARQQSRVFVLSHERLSGYPASGGYDSRTIADRLKQTFSSAKVLIIIREQRDVILSMYTQYLRDGGSLSLRRFLRGSPDPLYERVPMFKFEFYEYDLAIRYYQDAFGYDSVLVLPYELLVQAPQDFLSRVASFCGRRALPGTPTKPVNTTESVMLGWVRRAANTCLTINQLSNFGLINIPKANIAFDRVKPLVDTLPTRMLDRYVQQRRRILISRAVGDYYRDSNRRTEQLARANLAEYGYAI